MQRQPTEQSKKATKEQMYLIECAYKTLTVFDTKLTLTKKSSQDLWHAASKNGLVSGVSTFNAYFSNSCNFNLGRPAAQKIFAWAV